MELRAYSFIDSLQPQVTGFLQTVAAGFQPLEGQAALFVEIAPGIAINQLTDAALKRTRVMPGMQVVERSYGMLEVHHQDQGEVLEAGACILESMGVSESDRYRPEIVSSEIINGIEGYHQMIVNRMRHGDMIGEGRALYLLECRPDAYAVIAANEAEKASPISVLEFRSFGAFGRVYLGGGEAEIEEGVAAIKRCFDQIDGREMPKRRR